MSDILLFRSKNLNIQSKFISQLEHEFATLTQFLYTTDVSSAVLEREVLPYIAKNIFFKDPCQEINGKELYAFSIKGFHHMFHLTFDKFQLNIKLNDDGKTGRCIIDGIANFKQFSWIYTYPLRLIVVFEFRLLNNQSINEPQFEIYRHEEMWSLADLIDAIPGIGWFYKNIFRRGGRYLSVGVYALSCFIHNSFVQSMKKKE
ncbi:hypothetical protein I4U23_018292 [Adineta vaga]|nr:hypothetical protein I4U23_018292 [Adineta vaga]